MKNTFLILLGFLILTSSCTIDDNNSSSSGNQITDIRVNHYQDTSINYFFRIPGTSLLIQEGGNIGSDNYNLLSDPILGFDFDPGFIQDIRIQITDVVNPPQDASSIKIDLLEVLSKKAVPADTEFKVRLTLNQEDGQFVNWVEVKDTNYSIVNSEISINCGALCDQLSEKVNNEEQLTGIFTHGEGNSYVLKELLNE